MSAFLPLPVKMGEREREGESAREKQTISEQ